MGFGSKTHFLYRNKYDRSGIRSWKTARRQCVSEKTDFKGLKAVWSCQLLERRDFIIGKVLIGCLKKLPIPKLQEYLKNSYLQNIVKRLIRIVR